MYTTHVLYKNFFPNMWFVCSIGIPSGTQSICLLPQKRHRHWFSQRVLFQPERNIKMINNSNEFLNTIHITTKLASIILYSSCTYNFIRFCWLISFYVNWSSFSSPFVLYCTSRLSIVYEYICMVCMHWETNPIKPLSTLINTIFLLSYTTLQTLSVLIYRL